MTTSIATSMAAVMDVSHECVAGRQESHDRRQERPPPRFPSLARMETTSVSVLAVEPSLPEPVSVRIPPVTLLAPMLPRPS